jgi:hypothetical protein
VADPLDQVNLLAETKEAIKDSGHTPDDIVFIGSRESGHRCTWDQFTQLADVTYHNGFGAQEVASDLEIVFRDGTTMWRHEYDGSENWDYSLPFVMPTESKPITALTVNPSKVGWCTLAQIHEEAPS